MELQARLQEVLEGMEPLDREILALRHFEELSNNEVAQELGISKAAASNRYMRALVRLMNDCDNIIAVKEASGDLGQMKDVIAGRKESFSVLSGDDNITLDLIEAGGDGVISVASNLLPDRMVKMVHTALDGDMAGARALEAELADFFRAEFVETNPIPIKTALAMVGMCEEAFRLPMCELEKPEHREDLRNVMKNLGILD